MAIHWHLMSPLPPVVNGFKHDAHNVSVNHHAVFQKKKLEPLLFHHIASLL